MINRRSYDIARTKNKLLPNKSSDQNLPQGEPLEDSNSGESHAPSLESVLHAPDVMAKIHANFSDSECQTLESSLAPELNPDEDVEVESDDTGLLAIPLAKPIATRKAKIEEAKNISTDTGELPTVTEEEARHALVADLNSQTDFNPSSLSVPTADQDEIEVLLAESSALLAQCSDNDESVDDRKTCDENLALETGAFKNLESRLAELKKLPDEIKPAPSLIRARKPGSQTQTLNRIDFAETTKATPPPKLPQKRMSVHYGAMMLVTAATLIIALVGSFGTSRTSKDSAHTVSSLTKNIVSNPGNADLYLERGKLQMSASKYELALADFDKALHLSPKLGTSEFYSSLADCSEKLGRPEQASQFLTKAIKRAPQGIAKYLPRRAHCYMELKEYEKAGMDYQAVLGSRPNDAEINYLVGHTFYLTNNYEKALPFFSTAIAIDGANAKYYAERANSYFAIKQYNHALADYDQVLKLQPKQKEASEKRAIALNQTKKTISIGERAVANVPSANIAALTLMAKTEPEKVMRIGCQAMDSGNPVNAVDVFAVLIKNNPNDAVARHNLAQSLLAIKSFAQASAQYSALEKMRTLSFGEKSSYAQALAGNDQLDEAVALYHDVIQYGNNSADAQMELIDLLASNGRKKNAIQECKSAMDNPSLVNEESRFREKLASLEQEDSAAQIPTIGHGTVSGDKISEPTAGPQQPLVAPVIANPISPVRVRTQGNNQAINAWQNFKGVKKQK